MKQGQSLFLSQKLSMQMRMTPQLQQAIKLLTLSQLELNNTIDAFIEENPFLEKQDDDEAPSPAEAEFDGESPTTEYAADSTDASNSDQSERTSDRDADVSNGDAITDTAPDPDRDLELVAETPDADDTRTDDDWSEDIPEEMGVDVSWDDVFQTQSTGSAPSDEEGPGIEANESGETLLGSLLFQLDMARLSDRDRVIGLAIVDAINVDGYLTESIEDICVSFEPSLDIEADEVIAVLHLVQSFDPTGVGARDLRECLLLQLRQLPDDTPWLPEATNVLNQHLELLSTRNYNAIAKKSGLELSHLEGIMQLIRTLNPRPGGQIDSSADEYIKPEVIVRRVRDRWAVELNPEVAPRVRIVSEYAEMMNRGRRNDVRTDAANYLRFKDKLQEARWFLKGIRHRSETLLRVAAKIVELQVGFFDNGPEQLVPLVLRDVAEAIGVHESTISRVTKQKYMHTPRGVYELKYFFSAQIETTDGNTVANKAIQERIRKLIAEEDARRPLSDSQIEKELKKEGFKVARRTVAKYRDLLRIRSSNERRQQL